STERFAELVGGIKQMAGEMQRELDTTRQDLRRGVFELPQETAEGAAQMRRVIVDQIEALAELNRIVARHGRGLDAAEPQRPAPRRGGAAGRGAPRAGRGAGGGGGRSGAGWCPGRRGAGGARPACAPYDAPGPYRSGPGRPRGPASR